jgi:hypothetical protein
MILSANTCRKGGFGCAENIYSFGANASIINYTDSINTGDTIWLEIISPITQRDGINGQIITYRKASNLGVAFGIGELIVPTIKDASNDFHYILKKGSLVPNPNSSIREFNFFEGSKDYEFLIGIVPIKKGIFSLGLSNAANVYRKDDECTKASYRISFIDTEQHLYYITQVFGIVPDGTERTYCFKVI